MTVSEGWEIVPTMTSRSVKLPGSVAGVLVVPWPPSVTDGGTVPKAIVRSCTGIAHRPPQASTETLAGGIVLGTFNSCAILPFILAPVLFFPALTRLHLSGHHHIFRIFGSILQQATKAAPIGVFPA